MHRTQTSLTEAPERGVAAPESRRTPHAPFGLPELIAPAGDWECARAAVENGADAIYFGLEKFNARMRANNFTEADLPKLMEFLHRRGVKGYITFNILVFENEMAEAEQYVRAMIAAGVDAAVVQDVGICRLIRRHSPDFPIHASTQMTITSAAGVEFARELGCNQVVLARECSLKEIEAIQSSQLDNHQLSTINHQLPLEVFIHGALCVAYSGQCLTSEALGGRSANRGECAQACRMPYELVADGKLVPLGDRKYLLSPQDLAGLEVLPELVRLGVASLKIEGRLKSPEYVANITRIYRQALDRLSAEGQATRAEERAARDDRYEMEMAFSRGLHTGWFRGTNNQQLVHGRFGKKRGVFLGEVARLEGECVWVKLQGPLKPGDGVVFDAGRPEAAEEGGRVYEVRSPKSEIRDGPIAELCFGRGDIDFKRVHVGDKLWKTSDPELERRLRQSYAGDAPRFPRPIQMEVHGLVGQPLTLIVRDGPGRVVRVASTMSLARAESQPLTAARLREQLGRLGGTPFRLGELKNSLTGEVLLPVSELNRLRREAVKELETQRALPKRWTLDCGVRSAECGTESAVAATTIPHFALHTPHLIVLVRDLAQLEAALQCGVETLYCELEDPKKYREAVELVRRRQPATRNRLEIFVAPPRVFKMGEKWTLKQVRSSEADGYLVRNYDHLRFFASDRRIGDYSLNIANRLSAEYFKNHFGLDRVTASYDLNCTQLEALLQAAPPEWFELTVHQHIPMFHMEQCVFCAFLSTGTDYTNCGRPCDRQDLKLRDRIGAEHPVKADAGCRNTVFNALAQSGAEYVSRFLALGVRHFRIEFLDESPNQVALTIAKYRQLLVGEITGAQLWRELKVLNQLGVTRGQLGARESLRRS
jgi:putative protease